MRSDTEANYTLNRREWVHFCMLLGQLSIITESTTRGHNIQPVATNRALRKYDISQSHQQPSKLIVTVLTGSTSAWTRITVINDSQWRNLTMRIDSSDPPNLVWQGRNMGRIIKTVVVPLSRVFFLAFHSWGCRAQGGGQDWVGLESSRKRCKSNIQHSLWAIRGLSG